MNWEKILVGKEVIQFEHLSGVEDEDTCLSSPGKTDEPGATHKHIDSLHPACLLVVILPLAPEPPIAVLICPDRHLPFCRSHAVIITLADIRPQRSIQLVNNILDGDVCRAGR